ncbi:MAG: hypothetical protein ACTHJK_10020 [Sphingomicrobium sp.]
MKVATGASAFAKSVLLCVLIASAIPTLIFTSVLAITSGGFGSDAENTFTFVATMFVYVGVIALAFTLTAAILIGVPSTVILQRLNRESCAAYMILGGVTGFLLPLITAFVMQPTGIWGFAIVMGPIAGLVAGRVWWRTYRSHYAAEID